MDNEEFRHLETVMADNWHWRSQGGGGGGGVLILEKKKKNGGVGLGVWPHICFILVLASAPPPTPF